MNRLLRVYNEHSHPRHPHGDAKRMQNAGRTSTSRDDLYKTGFNPSTASPPDRRGSKIDEGDEDKEKSRRLTRRFSIEDIDEASRESLSGKNQNKGKIGMTSRKVQDDLDSFETPIARKSKRSLK